MSPASFENNLGSRQPTLGPHSTLSLFPGSTPLGTFFPIFVAVTSYQDNSFPRSHHSAAACRLKSRLFVVTTTDKTHTGRIILGFHRGGLGYRQPSSSRGGEPTHPRPWTCAARAPPSHDSLWWPATCLVKTGSASTPLRDPNVVADGRSRW